MLKLGIIAERQINGKRCLFEKLKSVECLSENNPFELFVVKIPYRQSGSARGLERKIKKARKLLEEQQVQEIIFSRKLKEYCENLYSDKFSEERNRLFLKISPMCIKQTTSLCGIKLLESEICIRDNNPGRIMEYLLKELCFETKKIVVCTKAKELAEKIRDDFYEETGFLIDISKDTDALNADIEINVQKPSVRIGRDVLIYGAELDFDLMDCDVDFLEVAACLDGFDASERISAYLLDKKKLTLLKG